MALRRGPRPVRQGRRGLQLLRAARSRRSPPATSTTSPTRSPRRLPGKAKIFFRPYAAPVEQPDANYDLWLVHRPHPRALAHRLDDPPRAGAPPRGTDGRAVHAPGRRREARAEAQRHRVDRVAPRQDQAGGRHQGPQPHADAASRVRRLLRRGRCSSTSWCSTPIDPISREADFKKCAVKVDEGVTGRATGTARLTPT